LGLVGGFIFGVYLQNGWGGAYGSTLTLVTGLPEVLISLIKALARPTPRIDPISVWELEAGIPKYQVPRFQVIAAASSENSRLQPTDQAVTRRPKGRNRSAVARALI